MDYDTITKRCRHAFQWWYKNNKPVWYKRCDDGEWILVNPNWWYDHIFVADDKNAEFAKAIIDGKKVEVSINGNWQESMYNNIKDVLEKGLPKSCTYRIKPERWRPKIGKKYYYMSQFLECRRCDYDADDADKNLIKNNNCFQTAEICRQAIAKVRETLNKFHRENNNEPLQAP